MNEEVLKEGGSTTNPVESITPVTLGKKLRMAREALHVTALDVSDQLRLPLEMVRSLETGNYPIEKMSPYIKGYVRNYARLLNLSPVEIEHWFEELGWKTPSPIPPQEIPKPVYKPTSGLRKKTITLMTGMVILLLITMVFLWWYSHSSSTTPLHETLTPATTIEEVKPVESIPEPPIHFKSFSQHS